MLRRVSLAFALALATGWLTAPSPAECRQCNNKKCFWNADCGRLCTCLFEGGKKRNKKGVCAQVGD